MGITGNGNCGRWAVAALVALLALGVACGDSNRAESSEKADGRASSPALEAPAPKRDGVVAPLSPSGPWIEFVRYPDTGVVEAYMLSGDDSEEEGRLRVALSSFGVVVTLPEEGELVVKLQAAGRGDTGEKQGDTSYFFGQSKALKGVSGTIPARIAAIELGDEEFEEVEFAL